MSRTSRRLACLLVASALVAGSCGGDDDATDDAAATTTTSSTLAEDGAGETVTTVSAPATDGSTTVAGGGSGSSTTLPASTVPGSPGEEAPEGVIELSIVDGNVEGGVRREKVKQGSQVTIRATSDVADELHVHTYDLTVDLVPGRSADLTFLAKIPGVHEVELEARHKKVLELEVSA